MACSYIWLKHTERVHTHTQMSSKNSHPGKRWIPQTAECTGGLGESWESGTPACSATKWAKRVRHRPEQRKDGSKIIHILIWRWQHWRVQRPVSEIYPHNVVSRLAGRSCRHRGEGRSITVLLPAWHSLGNPRLAIKVGVGASKVWESLRPYQIPALERGWVTR